MLRNQPEWLGSVYSQMSSNLPSASQRDFENEINDLIENQEDYLKWSLWVEDLQIALGEENVCTLLMEEMNQATFWKQLFGFMEIDDINPEEMIKLENTGENVKKTASNAWETISPQGSLKPLKKIVNEYWSRNKFPQARKIARNATRIYNRLVTRFNPRYDPQIQMTDELRRKVLDYCQASNAKLAEQLGRDDLKKLGY